jgi:peptide deformylase
MTAPLEFDVTIYPAPVLRKQAEPIESFDEDLKRTVEAMFERMRASEGVGLAAPQVGLRRRIAVVCPTGEKEDDLALVNPRILSSGGPRVAGEEGCLSFPGIYGEVIRPDRIAIRFQDLSGEEHEREFGGFFARVIQHELDHLEGVLLVDRMTPADKLRNKAELQELVEEYRAARAKARSEGAN